MKDKPKDNWEEKVHDIWYEYGFIFDETGEIISILVTNEKGRRTLNEIQK